MRIGILTYHCVTNFGAQLQTLSTIGYLKKKGFEPIVLNWFPLDLEEFYRRECPQIQFEEHFNFAQNEMPVSKLCRTLTDLCSEIDLLNLDAILIGSDALFDYVPIKTRRYFKFTKLKYIYRNITSNHDLPNPFWGSFNDLISKKIPYSGFSISSQNCPYKKLNKDELKETERLLNGFTLISVRDQWTKEMVEYISGRTDCFITPDPVFNFNNNNDRIIEKNSLLQKYNLPEDYILISFYGNILSDDFVNRIIKNIESKTGISCVSFPMPRKLRRFSTKYAIDLPMPTLDWYYLIKYSKGYIGELMHPIIVSIHNNVPFFCFDQYGIINTVIPRLWKKYVPESSKIYDILDRAGLLDCCCPYFYADTITPESVVDRFLSFDKKKCNDFALKQSELYKKGMDLHLSQLMGKK